MQFRIGLCGVLAVLAGFGATARADVQVVATLPDLAAIAAEVGGEHVTVQALASPQQDPHFVDARPSYIVALNRADLLIANGMELEIGWLPSLVNQARNPAINAGQPGYLEASAAVERLEIPSGAVTRAMGDVHTQGNPHFLFAPRAGAAVAEAIRDRLSQIDPEHATQYAANAEALGATLRAFAEEQEARFAALPEASRKVVCYHASMAYLTDWLQLSTVIHVEPIPGTPPNPGHVAQVLTTMRATGTHVLVQEEFYPTNTSDTLAQLAGGRLVVLDGGTRFADGQSYLEHMREIADALHEALSSPAGGE